MLHFISIFLSLSRCSVWTKSDLPTQYSDSWMSDVACGSKHDVQICFTSIAYPPPSHRSVFIIPYLAHSPEMLYEAAGSHHGCGWINCLAPQHMSPRISMQALPCLMELGGNLRQRGYCRMTGHRRLWKSCPRYCCRLLRVGKSHYFFIPSPRKCP